MGSEEPIDQGLGFIWEMIKIFFQTLVEFIKVFIEVVVKAIPNMFRSMKKGL